MLKSCTYFLGLALLLAAVPGAEAASLYEKARQGVSLYEKQSFDEALNKFVDAQIEQPEDAKLKFNIASTHYKMQNYEEAVKGFLDVAATARDAQLEEKALYNVGNAMYRQGKLEEAVEYYKKALELNPQDKDALQNLEFVRDEIKKRLNEAQKTAEQQKQQQQQPKEQQKQCQNPGSDNQTQQAGADNQTKQPSGSQEQQQMAGQNQQQQEQQQRQPQSGEQSAKQEQAAGSSGQEQSMSTEEAEQWLSSLQENRDKLQKPQQKEGRGMPRAPDKDW